MTVSTTVPTRPGSPPSADTLVLTRDVSKRYRAAGSPVLAVDRLSLELARGEFISIVGPSGCGKSTLLLMMAGLVPRSSGEITIGGKSVDQPYTDLGIVFQDPVLLDWRTVLANVLLQVEMRGLNKRRYTDRARELLRMVGLAGFEHRYPYELSGGMRQRVAICRALVHEPPLLLMDEPFGALDALTRDQLNLDLQNLWLTSRPTVLFVTHSIPEAVFLSDRVVVMTERPGRIDQVIDVNLPRPRRLSVRETPEFARDEAAIRTIFARLGVLREDAA